MQKKKGRKVGMVRGVDLGDYSCIVLTLILPDKIDAERTLPFKTR